MLHCAREEEVKANPRTGGRAFGPRQEKDTLVSRPEEKLEGDCWDIKDNYRGCLSSESLQSRIRLVFSCLVCKRGHSTSAMQVC